MHWRPDMGGFGEKMMIVATSYSASAEERDSYLLMDIDGDSWTDRIHIEGEDAIVYVSENQGQPRGVITRITNGLGAVTDVEYSPLSDGTIYARTEIDALPAQGEFCWGGYCGQYDYQASDVPGFYAELNAPWSGSHSLGNISDGTRKASPVLEMIGSMQVVSRVSSSSPGIALTGGAVNPSAQSDITYYYGEAKVQASGRGFLGFERLKTVDEQTQVETVTTYRQDFPFIGKPVSTEVRSPAGLLLRDSASNWELQQYDNTWPATAANDGTAKLGALQPVLVSSTETQYHLDEAATPTNEVALSTVTTTNAYDNYGNVLSIVAETSANGQVQMRQTTVNEYNDAGLARSAELGRLTRTTVTTNRDDNAPDNVRVVAFDYYDDGSALAGLLHTETIEPDGAGELRLVTTHQYDSLGNEVQVDVSGAVGKDGGGSGHTRSTQYTYSGDGRYLDYSTKNFGGTDYQFNTVTQRDAAGRPLTTVGASGASAVASVTRQVAFGALGRPYFEYDNTGAWATTYFTSAIGGCPATAVYRVDVDSASGSNSQTCYDKLGREVRSITRGFDGSSQNKVDTEYDVLGRVKRVSAPYASGSPPWTENTYDILGRLVRIDHAHTAMPTTMAYLPDSNVTGAVTKVVTTNPLGQVKTEYKNALGELVKVEGEEGSWVTYSYDDAGNLSATNAMGVQTTISYDTLGRKLQMIDPDKGTWSYKYNAFGELVEQTSANGAIVNSLAYDEHGRRVSRSDAKGTVQNSTTWTYDQPVFAGDRDVPGQLVSTLHTISGGEDAGTHLTEMAFDDLGRLAARLVELDGSAQFEESFSYDEHGRPFQKFDASGDFAGVRYHYNSVGYLERISEAAKLDAANDDPVDYYTVTAMDSWGNVTQAVLGDGTALTRVYENDSGFLTDMVATGNGGTVQDLRLIYDELGNLTRREDRGLSTVTSNTKSVDEDFTYDSLNRLKTYKTTAGAHHTIEYDSRGNITSKTNVGAYDYSAGTNQLKSVTPSGGAAINYTYDANGNLETGDGRTVEYTTFDKPFSIVKGGDSVGFAYDGERARYKRVEGTEVTYYIGNVEAQILGTGEQKLTRYIEGQVIQKVTRNAANDSRIVDSTHYQIKDHLGSIDAIVDSAGTLIHDLSFGPWGQRRDPEPPNTIINNPVSVVDSLMNLTPRGYTGHEMLDTVGLIHMNGRVYDPRLGRFLSADPFVQFPDSPQSYNRYSYVLNNPLNTTDPTGYFSFKDLTGMAVAAVGAYICGPNCGQLGMTLIGASAGGAQAAVNGDSIVRGVVFGGVSAAAFSSVGQHFNQMGAQNLSAAHKGLIDSSSLHFFGGNYLTSGQIAEQIAAHSILGGAMAELQGGKFGHGFLAAGFTKGVLGSKPGMAIASKNFAGRVAVHAVVGGTASSLTGGKFANGATTATFQVLFNEMSGRCTGRRCVSRGTRHPHKVTVGITLQSGALKAGTLVAQALGADGTVLPTGVTGEIGLTNDASAVAEGSVEHGGGIASATAIVSLNYIRTDLPVTHSYSAVLGVGLVGHYSGNTPIGIGFAAGWSNSFLDRILGRVPSDFSITTSTDIGDL